MLSINSNIPSLFASTNLNSISKRLQDLTTHISSGKRVLTASDDPAATGQLSTLKAQYASYNAVSKNLSAGQGLLTVASSSLDQQQKIMVKMKDLATQAKSDLLTASDRANVQASFTELQNQLDDVVKKATIFGQNLTSDTSASVTIQSGINSGDTKTINNVKSDAATLGIDAGTIDLSSTASAGAAMDAIDAAVTTVATNQSTIGAQQNSLKDAAEYVSVVSNNTKSAIGRIEDLDVAAASAELSQLQAQQQLSVATLGIINQLPQYALQLIR